MPDATRTRVRAAQASPKIPLLPAYAHSCFESSYQSAYGCAVCGNSLFGVIPFTVNEFLSFSGNCEVCATNRDVRTNNRSCARETHGLSLKSVRIPINPAA